MKKIALFVGGAVVGVIGLEFVAAHFAKKREDSEASTVHAHL